LLVICTPGCSNFVQASNAATELDAQSCKMIGTAEHNSCVSQMSCSNSISILHGWLYHQEPAGPQTLHFAVVLRCSCWPDHDACCISQLCTSAACQQARSSHKELARRCPTGFASIHNKSSYVTQSNHICTCFHVVNTDAQAIRNSRIYVTMQVNTRRS